LFPASLARRARRGRGRPGAARARRGRDAAGADGRARPRVPAGANRGRDSRGVLRPVPGARARGARVARGALETRGPAHAEVAMRAFAARLRTAAWLGWQVESNWADPFIFGVYTVVRPLATALI